MAFSLLTYIYCYSNLYYSFRSFALIAYYICSAPTLQILSLSSAHLAAIHLGARRPIITEMSLVGRYPSFDFPSTSNVVVNTQDWETEQYLMLKGAGARHSVSLWASTHPFIHSTFSAHLSRAVKPWQ